MDRLNYSTENNQNYLYNYTRRNPLFNKKYQDIVVTPKVDLIRFSIDKQINSAKSLNNFFNKINQVTIFKTKPLKQQKLGYNHSRKYRIKLNGKEYDTVLSECMGEPYMPYLWAIHDPKQEAMADVNEHLSLLQQYNINNVEYAFDFKYSNTKELYQFLKRTVLLTWRGKAFNSPYLTTHYLNNNYKAWSKTGKVYIKEVDNENGGVEEINRIEIALKYNWFKRHEIFKCLDIFKVGVKDVIKYLGFKEFNYNLFFNKLIGLEYTKEFIEELTELMKLDIDNGFLAETNQTAQTYCYNRNYLKKHQFHYHFRSMINVDSFWDNESFFLDSCLMD